MTGIYCYNQMILSAFEILHIWKFYIIKSFFKKIGFSFKLWCKISEISVLIHLSTQSSLKTKPCPSCSPGCPWWLTQCWYKGINMRSSPWSGTLSKDHHCSILYPPSVLQFSQYLWYRKLDNLLSLSEPEGSSLICKMEIISRQGDLTYGG